MPETIVPVNVAEQYKKDYRLYALYVCRERVTVDLRDGLKPVARRLLYATFDLKSKTKYPNQTKSAKIVGDTMGAYHPHGDCYFRKTLLQCLDGNEYTIGDLYENGINSLYVMGADPKTNKTIPVLAHSIRIGQYAKKIYHVTFSNGYTFTCTANHPIRMADGSWIKAEDLCGGMVPFRKPIRIFSGRPAIDNTLIQNIVYDYFYGAPPEGYVRHHKDGNPFNNLPDNFELKTRADHAKDHDDYNTGLDLGRRMMFELDGPIRERTKQKNSKLTTLYNKDQGIRRFQHAISVLVRKNMAITEENYETLRGEIYNLPKVDRLINKGHGSSFMDLVNLELPTIGELYQENPVDEVEFIKPITRDRDNKMNQLAMYNIFGVFDRIIMENGFIEYQLYCITTQNHGGISESDYNMWYQRYLKEYPIISSVSVEELDEPEPMYDFTVDEYENMFIPMGMNEYGSKPMLCIHNSSIYGAMKPLANDFEISVPLIHKRGNWGSKFGDKPAAQRYTEAGLTQFAQEALLGDMYETPNCVDWINNFDSTCKLPECFPAAVPLALVEGTFGIAVGFKVEIPSHNLSEVINATIALIRNRNTHVVLIPDHCQPCEIVESNFENISNIGMGSYTVRGIMEDGIFEGKPIIFIKSAPDMVYFKSIKKKIEEMITSKKLINVTSIDADNDDLLITLKPGSDVNYVKQLIYQNTDMEMNCRVNFEVLDNMVPMRMSYKAYILQWLEFRKFTKFRLYCNKLQQVNTRLHQIEPYVKVARSNDIISIIDLIRSRKVPEAELVEVLIKKFSITDIQAKFLLNIKIKELSEAHFSSYLDEYNKLLENKEHFINLVTNDNAIEEDIVEELIAINKKYKTKRRCKVVSKAEATGIPTGEFKVVITENNFIRKLPMNDTIPALKNDNVKFIIKGDNAENILIFTDTGKIFKYPIHKIPFADRRSNGVDIKLLIKNCTSNINAVIYEPTIKDFISKMRKYYVVTLTKNGYIKKMDMDDFLSANMSGLIYAKVDDGDYIKDVIIISDSSDVVVYSTNKAIRFSMTSVPHLKRATRGNKTMSDDVDGLSIIKADTTDIIVVTKKGYVNRFITAALAPADRTSAPSKVIKLTKGDEILVVRGLNNQDTMIVNTTSGPIEISVDSIPLGSSIGGGIKMVSNKTDTIVSCRFIHNK